MIVMCNDIINDNSNENDNNDWNMWNNIIVNEGNIREKS